LIPLLLLQLILRSPRTVHALQFCPYNENLLAGGCSNGQVVVWDLCDSLKKVEQDISLSPDKLKYRLALVSVHAYSNTHTTKNEQETYTAMHKDCHNNCPMNKQNCDA
jgi:hypothetical protein